MTETTRGHAKSSSYDFDRRALTLSAKRFWTGNLYGCLHNRQWQSSRMKEEPRTFTPGMVNRASFTRSGENILQ